MSEFHFDISPVNTTLMDYISSFSELGNVYGNYGPLIEETLQSLVYPYTDYDYGTLYEAIMSYGVSIETAEAISAYLKQTLGRMLNYSGILELCMENQVSIKVTSLGMAIIQLTPHVIPGEDTLRQQLIERELEAYENGDYIPPRMRLGATG